MKIQYIPISKDEEGNVPFLSSVLKEIPTNTILCKTLTGLGATYCECKADRDSIIVEPNIPVIDGKCSSATHANDNLFGVKKGVTKDDIKLYISNSLAQGNHLKFLTTPESFPHLQAVIEEEGLSIEANFFLLFDECHKIVQDCDYRQTITLPFELFFMCQNKALVSATPMDFSDQRFEDENFRKIVIQPTYDYSKDIKLLETNNIIATIQKVMDTEEVYFIFCNSVSYIVNIIRQLSIDKEYKVFCSSNSFMTLQRENLKNYSDTWDGSYMKYNFFTSRFYNAFDLELPFAPSLILISDSKNCSSSLLDPATDVQQIIGRFRNGVKSTTHLFTIDKGKKAETMEKIQQDVNEKIRVYNYIRTLCDTASTPESANAFLLACSALLPHKWYNQNGASGQFNAFAIDNYISGQYTISMYCDSNLLVEEYNKVQGINIVGRERVKEQKKLTIKTPRKTIIERRRKTVEFLTELGDCSSDFDRNMKEELRNEDPFIVKAFEVLGPTKIEELNYNRKKINEAIIMQEVKGKLSGNEIIKCISEAFFVGIWYSSSFIKKELKRIYHLFNIVPVKRITANTIKEFFEVTEGKPKNIRSFRIDKAKFTFKK